MPLDSYQTYLAKTKIPLRLACTDLAGWPVVVSLWYLYQDGALYCATQADAKVTSYLRANARCGYEIASDTPPYCGIRGRARAEIVPILGEEILMGLLTRYLGGTENRLATKLLQKRETEISIRLSPETVHAWNFTNRMKASVGAALKPCPKT